MYQSFDQPHFSSNQGEQITVPSGLEPLLALTSVMIEFAGLDFDSFIKSPESEEILYTSHNDMVCCDCTGESRREFLISDSNGGTVMQFTRTYESWWRNSWSDETMIVQAPAGSEIGRIHIAPRFWSTTRTITDFDGRELASIDQEIKMLTLSYVCSTTISDGTRITMGRMEWSNACSAIIMNVTFNPAIDLRLKVLMIASAYLIAMRRRERRSS
jgi:hypothetical protein